MQNASVRTSVRQYCDDVFLSKRDLPRCYEKVKKYMVGYIEQFDNISKKNKPKIQKEELDNEGRNNHSATPNKMNNKRQKIMSENVLPNGFPTAMRLANDDIRSRDTTEKKAAIINKIKSSFQIPVNVSYNFQ